MSTYDELLARVTALEDRGLRLGDLPIKALQDKLEQDWQPNGSMLLGPRSVTEAMLSLRIVRGEVDAAGNVVRGSGFLASRAAAGNYDVAFATAFTTIPVVVGIAGPTANPAGAVLVAKINAATPPTAAGFRMNTQNSATGVATDSLFDFIAIGV